MAEIIDKNQTNKLHLKLHKFDTKCLTKCILFQSKLNLKQPITSTLGFPKVKSICYLKNQNPQLFDEKTDTITEIETVASKLGNDGLTNFTLSKQNFPINVSKLKQNEYFSEKVTFLLEFELDSKVNEDINTFKHISVDYAKLNFEIVINGKCHEMKVFNNDLKFNIDGFQIIKAMQNRLDNFKKEIYCRGNRIHKNEFLSFIVENNFHLRFLFSCPSRMYYYLLILD